MIYTKGVKMINIIIFSKNRAAQLDLLLNSIKMFFVDWNKYTFNILYTFDNEEYKKGYDIVKNIHSEFNYVREIDFKQDVLSLMKDNPYTIYGVDDDVFIDKFSMDCQEINIFNNDEKIYCVSLRMHPKMNYCYTMNIFTNPPIFIEKNIWNWYGHQGDWEYPHAIDLSLFRTKDIINMVKDLNYNNPNSFEGVCNCHRLNKPLMMCFDKAKIVNIPLNRVNGICPNRCENISAEYLNNQLLSGKRIKKFEIPIHNAPHCPANIFF